MRTAALILMLLGLAQPAAADTDDAALLAEVAAGLGYAQLKQPDLQIHRTSTMIAPSLTFRGGFTLAWKLRLSRPRVLLTPTGAAGAIGTAISFPWQVSIGAEVRYRFIDYRRFGLAAWASFEFPPAENDDKLDVALPAVPAMMLPAQSYQDGAEGHHYWRLYCLGLTSSYRFGPLTPWLDLGLRGEENRVAVIFNQGASQRLMAGGVTPKRIYEANAVYFAYAVGADLALGSHLRLRGLGGIIPTAHGNLYQGELTLVAVLY